MGNRRIASPTITDSRNKYKTQQAKSSLPVFMKLMDAYGQRYINTTPSLWFQIFLLALKSRYGCNFINNCEPSKPLGRRLVLIRLTSVKKLWQIDLLKPVPIFFFKTRPVSFAHVFFYRNPIFEQLLIQSSSWES